MKTIQQRLQSRISKRRNVIRECEEEVSMLVLQRRWLREEDTDGATNFCFINAEVREAKQYIADMAGDQKLDKQLAGIVLGLSQTRRHYGLSDY